MALEISPSLAIAYAILTWSIMNAKVIVFFPVPATSHILNHINVAREMSTLGHEAWVCVPESEAKNDNLVTSGINIMSYKFDLEEALLARRHAFIYREFWGNQTWSLLMWHFATHSAYDKFSISVLENRFADRVKDVQADLFVIDGLPYIRGMYVVPYKLGIPYAVLGVIHDVIPYRLPFSPVATPIQMTTTSDLTNIWDRIKIAFTYFLVFVDSTFLAPDVVSMFAAEKPHRSVSQLMSMAEVYILELDPIMDYARPTLPNTKLVGATAVKPPELLKDPFKKFVDESESGLIVITFGTTAVHVPNYIFEKFNAACMATGLNVIWRVDHPSPDPKRVLTFKWIPQNDILAHVNTKLFISHCGNNGQYEALYHSVPMLCVPVFRDQPYNSERIRSKGYGLVADMRFIQHEDLTEIVSELITNKTYKNNIVKASKLFRLLYKSPLKEASFWLDHVMEYGGSYMRSASQKMPLYQFLMLDIFAVGIVIIVASFLMLYYFIHSCFVIVFRTRQTKSKLE